ncbi:hypothetical protein BDF20DRAFT_833544 [Mycotypha africana]|uniref:uncharacterized protein n=1 Tax=Mycotypha africana TaxID=64632 RepID=UPI0023017DB6|nr:uncharacterized protein BDF20DRAFT_833544 [Mycotypha africana]KAI8983998.1 hypothetical protein BDF20DRAFT_833544 [Mycotypha africana]
MGCATPDSAYMPLKVKKKLILISILKTTELRGALPQGVPIRYSLPSNAFLHDADWKVQFIIFVFSELYNIIEGLLPSLLYFVEYSELTFYYGYMLGYMLPLPYNSFFALDSVNISFRMTSNFGMFEFDKRAGPTIFKICFVLHIDV